MIICERCGSEQLVGYSWTGRHWIYCMNCGERRGLAEEQQGVERPMSCQVCGESHILRTETPERWTDNCIDCGHIIRQGTVGIREPMKFLDVEDDLECPGCKGDNITSTPSSTLGMLTWECYDCAELGKTVIWERSDPEYVPEPEQRTDDVPEPEQRTDDVPVIMGVPLLPEQGSPPCPHCGSQEGSQEPGGIQTGFLRYRCRNCALRRGVEVIWEHRYIPPPRIPGRDF